MKPMYFIGEGECVTEEQAKAASLNGFAVLRINIPDRSVWEDIRPLKNTCPICRRSWLPNSHDDIYLPTVEQKFGTFHPERNDMPCFECGIKFDLQCMQELINNGSKTS